MINVKYYEWPNSQRCMSCEWCRHINDEQSTICLLNKEFNNCNTDNEAESED